MLAGLHNIATKAREVELSLQSMGKAMDRAVASGRKIGSVGGGGGGGLSGIGSGGNPTAAYARIRVAQEQTTRAQMAADAKLAQQRERLVAQSGLVEQRTARAAVQVERERISLRGQTLRLGQQEAAIAQRSAASQASTMRANLNQARQTVQAQQQITRYQQQQRAQLGGGLGGFIGNLLTPGQRASGNAIGGRLGGIGGALANIFGANQPQQQQGRSALGGAASAAGRGIRSVGVGGIAFGSLLGNLGARAVVGAGQFAQGQLGQTFDAIQSNERLNSSFQTLIARDLMQQNKGLSGADALQQALPATKDLRGFVLQKAIKSPFGEEDVAGIFQKFLTVGFTQAEGKKMTTEMVDLASAYRLDGSEMGRLAKALGDVKSRGTLSAEEVRQFVNARFDIQGALANVLGKSREEIVKLQKEKKITIDDVMKAFDSVAGAEPIQGSAERLANSWGGLAETLHDVGRVMRRELGAGSFDALQPYVVRFSNFLQEQLASGKVKELGQKLGGFVASGLDMGEKAIGRLSTAWETFNRVREMGLPKTAVGMGLAALGLPEDLSRTVASWSVDAVTAIQTGIGKVRSALSTYSQVKGDGGSTAYATFSALEAAGLPADVATTIGNWAGIAEVELGKLGPRLQKAIRDGATGSTVGLWELIGIQNDVATKIDAEIKQAASEIGKGLAQLPSEIDAYKKLASGETSGYDFLKGRGADPNSIGMRGIQTFGKVDDWMKNHPLPTWAQPFGENGQPHPGWAAMGMGPNAPQNLPQPPDLSGAGLNSETIANLSNTKPTFDAYVASLQAVDQANQAAAVSAGMLGQAIPPATAAIGGMTSVTDPAATSLGAMTMAADPASASLNNVGTGGQSAALGVSALNSAASTTDLAAATDQYLALSRALYAVSGSYQTAAEKAESAKKSLEHFNMPEALVQHSPSPFEQALLDAGEAGVNFSNSMRLAGVGIAGASRAVQMGQAEWEDFGIAMKNSGNIAAGLDPVDRGSLATASTMNAGLARPVSAGGARQTGAAIPIKGKTPGLVQQAKSPEIKPVDLRAEAWNKKVSGAMGAVSGLTGERERGDIGRIAEQYLMKLGVTPDESRTVGDYVRSSINTRRDKNGNLPDLQQALEAFGTPSGDSMADEVQKFLERLGVTNDRIEGATEALTRAENGVKNKMGPQVPEAVTTGQKLLKDQLEGLLGRAGVSKENIPGALEKLHGSGALEGLDQQLFQTRQTGIADQIANMLGGQDSKERRARVAAIMGSGAFGDFNPDWLNTPTAAQDRQELQTRRNDTPRYADGTSVPTSGTDRTTASVQGATAIIQVVLDPDKMVDLVLPRAVDRLKLQGIRPG